MNGKMRVLNMIAREPVDRLPRFDSFWEDTLSVWKTQGFPSDVTPGDFFDFDIRLLGLDMSMRLEHKILEQDDEMVLIQDRHGFTARKFIGKSRALEFDNHVTTDRDAWNRLKHNFEFDVAEKSRIDEQSYFLRQEPYPTWEETKVQFDKLRATGKYLLVHGYGPWEGTWRHRGYTNLLMDIALDPEWCHEMGQSLVELMISSLSHALKMGIKPDGLWLVDDLAYTNGMLFSPEAWRQIYKPLYQRLGLFLKQNGIQFWLHCCGNSEVLFPDFIECGIQVIQPLQAHSGLDIRKLKPKYGKSLTFWGNIDVRKISGSPAELEEEIRSKLPFSIRGGGYIYHSDHSIPPEVSFSQYKWLIEELLPKYGAPDFITQK